MSQLEEYSGKPNEVQLPTQCDSDEEYFDASETTDGHHLAVTDSNRPCLSPTISVTAIEGDPPEIEEDNDFYESTNFQSTLISNRSVLLQILSRVRIGMDLTRFVLPAFLFEKRSALELFADFFAHPDIILRSADIDDPKERIILITKWFLSSISASRKIGIPQKPYNPVLGEQFLCYWDIAGGRRTAPNVAEERLLAGGPHTFGGYNSLSYIGEQVSHHPPISALYLECPGKRFFIEGSVETKIKFQLGLSVKVQNHGKIKLHFLNQDEVYVGCFPNIYVRSLLTTPWMEYVGECNISCAKTGYSANVEFHSKPFRGGTKHRITANIKHGSQSKPLMKLEGHWNSLIYKKISKNEKELFMDVQSIPCTRKKIKKFSLQGECESRIVWKNLTEALEREDSETASLAKHEVEERQRQKAKERKEAREVWEPKHFKLEGDGRDAVWVYKNSLPKRLKDLTAV